MESKIRSYVKLMLCQALSSHQSLIIEEEQTIEVFEKQIKPDLKIQTSDGKKVHYIIELKKAENKATG